MHKHTTRQKERTNEQTMQARTEAAQVGADTLLPTCCRTGLNSTHQQATATCQHQPQNTEQTCSTAVTDLKCLVTKEVDCLEVILDEPKAVCLVPALHEV